MLRVVIIWEIFAALLALLLLLASGLSKLVSGLSSLSALVVSHPLSLVSPADPVAAISSMYLFCLLDCFDMV